MACYRSPGDPASKKPYLPDDKQMLVTRNGELASLRAHVFVCARGGTDMCCVCAVSVPCRRRVRDLAASYQAETRVRLDDGDGGKDGEEEEEDGWLATHTTAHDESKSGGEMA